MGGGRPKPVGGGGPRPKPDGGKGKNGKGGYYYGKQDIITIQLSRYCAEELANALIIALNIGTDGKKKKGKKKKDGGGKKKDGGGKKDGKGKKGGGGKPVGGGGKLRGIRRR